MANLNNLKNSPLNGSTFGDKKSVFIKEKPYATTLDVRLKPNSKSQKIIEKALKIKLPLVVGQTFKNKKFTILTLGPDWWLIVGANLNHERLLRSKLNDEFASIVDVSAQRTFIEVSGKFAKEVLEHGWELNLDQDVFKPGMCAQSVIARSPAILYHGPMNTYHLYVRSSFAQHLWNFLTDASTEYINQ
jgi:sarcosine oxidase subunit gamma